MFCTVSVSMCILQLAGFSYSDTLVELNLFIVVLLSVEGVQTNVVVGQFSANLIAANKPLFGI